MRGSLPHCPHPRLLLTTQRCGGWRGGGWHTNDGAPRTQKQHQQEHRPQQPTKRTDPTQHAKGKTGDCPLGSLTSFTSLLHPCPPASTTTFRHPPLSAAPPAAVPITAHTGLEGQQQPDVMPHSRVRGVPHHPPQPPGPTHPAPPKRLAQIFFRAFGLLMTIPNGCRGILEMDPQGRPPWMMPCLVLCGQGPFCTVPLFPMAGNSVWMASRDVLDRLYTVGGGGVALRPFQCLRLTAKILLRRLQPQEDLS